MDKMSPNAETDLILLIAGWIQNFCDNIMTDYTQDERQYDAVMARLSIKQWTEKITTIMKEAVEVPCPSCKKMIPLELDHELITHIVMDWLEEPEDIKDIKRIDIDFIKKRLIEDSGAHPIPCKGHNQDCKFNEIGWITLSDLMQNN